MKRLVLALGLLALVALAPNALSAKGSSWTIVDPTNTKSLSLSCAQYCRTVCIANGETCASCGFNCCACN